MKHKYSHTGAGFMPDKRPAPEVPDHVIESFARCIYPAHTGVY